MLISVDGNDLFLNNHNICYYILIGNRWKAKKRKQILTVFHMEVIHLFQYECHSCLGSIECMQAKIIKSIDLTI